ncbi:MAG: DMT family transporter [Pseudomonadales bacterium]|nr:DMT family transporter [Pseudomonadales bacterium]
MAYLPILALLAGAAIAIQAPINAHLGVLLNSAMWASATAFLMACLFTLIAILCVVQPLPSFDLIKQVPLYLWCAGGALSAFGVGMFYFLIPKMGVGPMMSYALAGQLILATLFSHYGLLGLPQNSMDIGKLLGVTALLLGVGLINGE